jgi:hypothetical protein
MRASYHRSGRKKRVASFPTTLSFEGFARSPLLEAIALSLFRVTTGGDQPSSRPAFA